MVRSCNKGALSRPQISKQGRLQRRCGISGPFIAARLVVHYARGRRPHRAHRQVLQGTAPSTVPAPTVPLRGALGASAHSSDRGELCPHRRLYRGIPCWLSQKEKKSNRTELHLVTGYVSWLARTVSPRPASASGRWAMWISGASGSSV